MRPSFYHFYFAKGPQGRRITPPLNPDPAFLSVMGVMRRQDQGGGGQPEVVGTGEESKDISIENHANVS